MRPLVEPPPSTHCKSCGGELRLKCVESDLPTPAFQEEIFVCENCGYEQSFIVVIDEHSGPSQT
jgi:C4-type Zn-finger protein